MKLGGKKHCYAGPRQHGHAAMFFPTRDAGLVHKSGENVMKPLVLLANFSSHDRPRFYPTKPGPLLRSVMLSTSYLLAQSVDIDSHASLVVLSPNRKVPQCSPPTYHRPRNTDPAANVRLALDQTS